MELLTERYSKKIAGTISCYDRVIIQGILPGICYAKGMTGYLYDNKIKIFDYPRFAEPLRDELKKNAEAIAKDNGLEIEFIRKKNIRKESRIKKIIESRGDHPGLVHIFSAMESCQTYKPWHNKKTHKTYLKFNQSKCLHYYFYFIDEYLGLSYVRVPTWCPFRLQIYFNGHNWLASELKNCNTDYTLIDNAFTNIDSFTIAQKLSNSLSPEVIHKRLDNFAKKYCPVIKHFGLHYHWSIMQAEYATDIVFKRQKELQDIYGQLTRTAIHTVKPENVATFLGRKLHPNYQDEMGNRFNTRIEGTRISHSMGKASIKMYDKFGLILRIETTVNDVSFFKHYRKVEHRDGSSSMKFAAMKKGIYSFLPLQELLRSANSRYLEFISEIDDHSSGIRNLERISKSKVKKSRSYKGFNLFSEDDQLLFESIVRGEFHISGFQNKHIRKKLANKNSGQVSRILKRLHVHGLIKKVGHTYKYYLTKLGLRVVNLGLKLQELVVIPALA
jgi:hypothetical protein